MSAIIIGFSIVIFEGSLSALGFKRPLELPQFKALSSMLVWVLATYLLVRFADLIYRDALWAANETPARKTMFLIENLLFVIPLLILSFRGLRSSGRLLFLAATCLVLGGAVLRFNGLIVGFHPSAGYTYAPSAIELLVSIGLLALEVIGFVYIVKRFPILPLHTGKPVARPQVPAGLSTGHGAA